MVCLVILANQETIVELMGFARRVFPDIKPSAKQRPPPPPTIDLSQNSETMSQQRVSPTAVSPGVKTEQTPPPRPSKTEITFDFHRLNVLLLRAVIKDGCLHGRKIATATMSEARIQATVGKITTDLSDSVENLLIVFRFNCVNRRFAGWFTSIRLNFRGSYTPAHCECW